METPKVKEEKPKVATKAEKSAPSKKKVKEEVKEESEEEIEDTPSIWNFQGVWWIEKGKRASTKRNAATKPSRGRGKKAKVEEGEEEEEEDALSEGGDNDENAAELNDACEEDINNFKPGQTKPTPSPVGAF